MYVKFCSGPTPRYTPPGVRFSFSRGMTYWNCCSFDMYSNRKKPPSSENSETNLQNVASLSSRGRVSAAKDEGTIRRSALTSTVAIRITYLREHSYTTVRRLEPQSRRREETLELIATIRL